MKQVRYVGPQRAVQIEHPPGRYVTVANGESVEMPDRLAALFGKQDVWEIDEPKTTKKAAKAAATKEGDDAS